jgi:amino acid transporter
MSFIIVGIAFVIIMLGYSILISAMPRSGGGYVAISRIISPFAAFVATLLEFVSIASTFGVIAVWTFGAWLLVFAKSIPVGPVMAYSDVGVLAAGLVLLALMTALCGLGARVTSYVLQALFLVLVPLGLYLFYLLGVAIANPSTLQSGITAWAQAQGMAGVTADTYVKAALAQGLDAANVGNYWTAVSASLLGAYWCYVGYAALTFVPGEFKEPDRNLPKIALAAPLIIMAIYVLIVAFSTYAAAAVGQTTLANGDRWSFYEAYAYLSYGGGNLQQAGVPNLSASVPTIAAIVGSRLGLASLNILLLLFLVLMYAKDLPPLVLTGSRIIFAMSFDGVLPASFSKVDDRFHSPVFATIVVGLFGVLGALAESCVFCNGGSWGPGGVLGSSLTAFFTNSPIYNIDLLDAVFFSLFSLAVVLFPFRRRDLFESARFKPGGKLGTAAIGLAGLTANLVIAWLILTSPQDAYNILAPVSANWYALGSTVVFGIIGALIYVYYRYGRPSKHLDYGGIFSEVPAG